MGMTQEKGLPGNTGFQFGLPLQGQGERKQSMELTGNEEMRSGLSAALHYKLCFVAFIHLSIQTCKQFPCCDKERTTFVSGAPSGPAPSLLALLLTLPGAVLTGPAPASVLSLRGCQPDADPRHLHPPCPPGLL